MDKIGKNFWLAVAVVAAIFVVALCNASQAYLYYYREQTQLFLNDPDYIRGLMGNVGGAGLVVSQFLVQYFLKPFAGPIATGILAVAGAAMLWLAFRRKDGSSYLFPICLVPFFLQVLCLDDMYYHYDGFVAFFLSVACVWAYSLSARHAGIAARAVLASAASLALYFLTGPAAILFAVLVAMTDILSGRRGALLGLVPVALVVIAGFAMVYSGHIASLRRALWVDFYYESTIVAPVKFSLPWIAAIVVPLLVSFGSLFRFRPVWDMAFGVVLAAGVCVSHFAIVKRTPVLMYPMAMMQHFAENEDWDGILGSPYAHTSDFMSQNYVNMALSRKGELLDRLFEFGPHSVLSLNVDNGDVAKIPEVAAMLSRVYFEMGNIGAAQNKAFDAEVAFPFGSPSMLQMLVKTNLIFGYYRVAEKYLAVLSKTTFYASWAEKYSRFLDDDSAVEADPEMGPKRRSLPQGDYFSFADGPFIDMMHCLDANPSDKGIRDYAIAFMLLAKDKKTTEAFIGHFRGTPALEEIPPVLQQAIALYYADEPAKALSMGASQEVIDRFAKFNDDRIANSHSGIKPEKGLAAEYGNTFWYYFLFRDLRLK